MATEAIRQRIVEGDLAAGDKLPPERVLVDELGVSRTVLREALSSLEALGLIEVRGRRGRFVTSGGSSERSSSIVSAWLHQHAPKILEVDEIRSVLEAHAVRAMSEWDAIDAARRAGAQLARQREAIAAGDAIAAADADAAFHRCHPGVSLRDVSRCQARGHVLTRRCERPSTRAAARSRGRAA